MRDIIGKRNWFFAFSLALIVPGIIFILLGPLTGGEAGLQFSIDYTGGTKWEIRFEDTLRHAGAGEDRPGVRRATATRPSRRPPTTSS